MYIEQQDFKIICDDRDYKVLAQASDDNRNNAIKLAIDEASGYLCSKYDVSKEYEKIGINRNYKLVNCICDIALWHLVANLSDYEGFEIRETRYNNAIQWLKDIQAGNITLNIPFLTDDKGNEIGNSIQFGGLYDKTKWDW